MQIRRNLLAKTITVLVAGGVAFGAAGGAASAAPTKALSANAKEYQKIVAPLNKVLNASNPPTIKHLRADFKKTEHQLTAAHFPAKSGKDVNGLVKAMKTSEPVLEKFAKNPNFNPKGKTGQTDKKLLATLFSQIDKVRGDFGLKPANQSGF
jgi:hypothetical protein